MYDLRLAVGCGLDDEKLTVASRSLCPSTAGSEHNCSSSSPPVGGSPGRMSNKGVGPVLPSAGTGEKRTRLKNYQ